MMNWLLKLHRWLRRKGTPRVIITDGEHSFPAYISRKDGRLYARTTRGLEELRHDGTGNVVEGRQGATWRWDGDNDN